MTGRTISVGLGGRSRSGQRRRDERAANLVTPLRLGAALIGIVSIAFGTALWLSTGPFPIDTFNYISAGARLNAGQPLYAAAEQSAGYAQVALFSPPLMAVIVRPLAMLPDGLGMSVWVVVMAACAVSAMAMLLVRSPAATGVAMAVLAPSIVLTMVVGNVDALVLLSIVVTWLLLRDGHDREAGLLIGLVTSLKLTPAALIWWMLVTRRWRAAAFSIGACAGLAVVAMLGSEPLAFVRFVEVTLANYGGSPGYLSVANLGRLVGLDPALAAWLPRLALVGGLVLVLALRRRPAAAYAVAVSVMVLGSPVTAFHSPVLLLGMLVPFVAERARGLRRSSAPVGATSGLQA